MTTIDDFLNKNTKDRLKNESAWKKLFETNPVLDEIKQNGVYHINAQTLNKVCQREPRLMVKIESKTNLPSVLKCNKLCILPDKNRGNYVIGHFNAFTKISYENQNELDVPTEPHFDTLNPFAITKEPGIILSAFNYGILNILADEQEVRMTNFGRESTNPFSFKIDNLNDPNNPYTINVGRSQLEMDGVFESEDYIINIEAKMKIRNDFLIRQLYYPYRLLNEQTEKKILNVFMTYSTGTLYAHIYKFDDIENYNSISLMESYKFNFTEEISVSDIANIIYNAKIVDEPVGVPFPQANCMERVFDTLDLINSNEGISDADIAYSMSIDPRQGGYYGNACKYLGLTERIKKQSYENYLSKQGKELLSLSFKQRKLKMIELLCRHKVFNHFLKEYLEQRSPPDINEIIEWIKTNVTSIDADKGTPGRRASTVKQWIEWVMSCTTDY